MKNTDQIIAQLNAKAQEESLAMLTLIEGLDEPAYMNEHGEVVDYLSSERSTLDHYGIQGTVLA